MLESLVKAALSKREYFKTGTLRGYYPYRANNPMTYLVKSDEDVIALFDGDTWHISDSDFHPPITKEHLRQVKSVLGDHDEYSMFPVVPTLASMEALMERLGIEEL